MAYQGTFQRFEPGQYGGKIVVATQKGEWKLDNKTRSEPQFASGTPVSFEANKSDRGFWHCTSITAAGGGQQQSHQRHSGVQQAQAPLTYHPDPSLQAGLNGASQSCAIFVTGFLQQTNQGVGTFPGVQILRDWIREARLAWEVEMENKTIHDPAPQQQYDDRNPPADDFGSWPQ